MKKLKVLVACEESQRVCIAFRERGFEAFGKIGGILYNRAIKKESPQEGD